MLMEAAALGRREEVACGTAGEVNPTRQILRKPEKRRSLVTSRKVFLVEWWETRLLSVVDRTTASPNGRVLNSRTCDVVT